MSHGSNKSFATSGYTISKLYRLRNRQCKQHSTTNCNRWWMELWGQNCHAKIRVLRPSQNFARMTNTISSIRAVNIRMTTPGGGVYSTSVPYFIRNKGIRKSQILTTLNFVTKVLHFMLHFILVEAKCFATMQRAIKKRNITMQTGSSEDEIH